ncbi:MAG: cytidylate kinase family protein [Pseudomonadota bacterium]
MTVIAMTREMGTLGKDVAHSIAVEFGLGLVHHELVRKEIAGKLDVEPSDVHRFLEGMPSLWDRWKIDERKLSRYTREEILELADRENVLIRGWGAPYLLRDVPHVVRIRVCAPMSFRIGEMKKRLNIEDDDVARREIERNDAGHTRAMRSFFDTDWEHPLNYHMVLNTGSMPVSACIDQIRLLIQNPVFERTEASRQILRDKILETRITDALDENVAQGFSGSSVDVRVSNGHVALTGTAYGRPDISSVEELMRGIAGVESVESNLVHVDPPYIG